MAARTHSDLTVAVIHYQTPDLLERCLARLRMAAPAARLLVVDTGDQRPLGPEWSADHPGIELVRQVNHSYSAAVNAALRRCETPRFAQMNSDVLVEQETFDALSIALERSGAAICGPLPVRGDGRLQRHGLPYRLWQWRARGKGMAYAPWLSGCLHYLRTDVAWSLGGMDTSLRFYNEDIEWCLRLRAAGERCVLVDTKVVHLGGSSTPAAAAPAIEGLRGGFQLTRRYRGPLARAVHWAGLLVAASFLSRFAERSETRAAYRRFSRMLLRTSDWGGSGMDESPFGPTLASENPTFANGGEA